MWVCPERMTVDVSITNVATGSTAAAHEREPTQRYRSLPLLLRDLRFEWVSTRQAGLHPASASGFLAQNPVA